MTIEINDQKSYLNLIELADKSGSVKITKIDYDHEQITNLRKANLANACKRIMIRKDVYEQNLGLTLLPVSILENAGSSQSDGFDQSPNGQITIKNSIQITFAIIPASSSSLAKATAGKTDSEPTPSPTPASE